MRYGGKSGPTDNPRGIGSWLAFLALRLNDHYEKEGLSDIKAFLRA